jgi:hypothetical protein
MKTIKVAEKTINMEGTETYKLDVNGEMIINKLYQAEDGKTFSDRNDCFKHEKKIKTIADIKASLATVFDNSEDVYNSLYDGLCVMLETDRKTVLNGLINLTVDKKVPVRKNKKVEVAV